VLAVSRGAAVVLLRFVDAVFADVPEFE